MRVAAIQMRSGTSIAENSAAVEELIKEAAAAGASYVQTPEMTGILQKNRKGLFSELRTEDEDILLKRSALLAQELGIWLHIGSHAISLGSERAANRAFIYSPSGDCVARYDKIHMFDVDLENGESWRESKVYEPGKVSQMIEIDSSMVGLSICYDIRFPNLYRQQALAGAHILTAPSSFTLQTGRAHWHLLMRARAAENGAFMIAAAQGGDHADGRETFGHSLVVNPWGEIVAELSNRDPGVLIADLDLSEVARARRRIPNLANTRNFVLETASQKIEAAQ